MSWSFSQTGPVSAVKNAFDDYRQANPVANPEDSARKQVSILLGKLEGGFSADWHCAFTASGSQSVAGGDVVNSTVNVSITPVAA